MLKQKFLRYGLGLLITFILFANASGMIPFRFIETLENLSYDFRLRLTLPPEIDKKVVIIDIDEKAWLILVNGHGSVMYLGRS